MKATSTSPSATCSTTKNIREPYLPWRDPFILEVIHELGVKKCWELIETGKMCELLTERGYTFPDIATGVEGSLEESYDQSDKLSNGSGSGSSQEEDLQDELDPDKETQANDNDTDGVILIDQHELEYEYDDSGERVYRDDFVDIDAVSKVATVGGERLEDERSFERDFPSDLIVNDVYNKCDGCQ
jgi:hypothetical protein